MYVVKDIGHLFLNVTSDKELELGRRSMLLNCQKRKLILFGVTLPVPGTGTALSSHRQSAVGFFGLRLFTLTREAQYWYGTLPF